MIVIGPEYNKQRTPNLFVCLQSVHCIQVQLYIILNDFFFCLEFSCRRNQTILAEQF